MNDDLRHDDFFSPADAAALDALIASGLDPARADPAHRARAAHIAGLLSVLHAGRTHVDPALVDVTLARIQSLDAGADLDAVPALSGDDIEALDAYMNAGMNVSRVAPSLRARAGVVDGLGHLVTQTPIPLGDSVSLIERTLLAVKDEREIAPIPIGRGRAQSSFRLADVASIAAVLVLGVSALFPVLSSWSTRRDKSDCVANLGGIATALGSYGNDYAGSLPIASASVPGERWWDVGQGPQRSNSANLFALKRGEYTTLDQLACDGNPHAVRALPEDAEDWQNLDQVSYSYYVMFGPHRPDWRPGLPRSHAMNQAGMKQPASTVVLADASPVIRRALRGGPIYTDENSPNHAGMGQWAVHADGSASWMQSPMIGQDNIWLPANMEEVLREIQAQMGSGEKGGNVEVLTREAAARQRALRLHGNEAPASADDSFVGP